ncbi:hypothetical protein [Micromonospora sp. NPDC050276]|uniref:hypothetical protein n=1 Tax=Micromonospora sp. NPDC050276 TaxID=3364278 RepID=UPI00379E6621
MGRPPVRVCGVLAVGEVEVLGDASVELRNLDGLRRGAEDPVVGLLLTAASRHVSADLSFVDDAESVLLGDGGQVSGSESGRAAG